MIWDQLEADLVLVVEQILLNQLLEYSTLIEFISHSSRILIDFEEAQRITTMKAKWYELRQVSQANVIFGLLGLELNLVQDCFKNLLVEA